jgi:hypothetical protein
MREGSLVIVDSLKAYSYLPYHNDSNNNSKEPMFNIILMVGSLLKKQSETICKRGITIISDIGSFYQSEKLDDLIRYETSFPQERNLKYKAFCSYRKDFFDLISQTQQKRLFEHHYRNLIV